MSEEDRLELRRGQIKALQHVCALIVNRLAPDDATRAAFLDLLNSHSPPEWETTKDTHFHQGLTDSLSEVSLKILVREV